MLLMIIYQHQMANAVYLCYVCDGFHHSNIHMVIKSNFMQIYFHILQIDNLIQLTHPFPYISLQITTFISITNQEHTRHSISIILKRQNLKIPDKNIKKSI